MSLISSTVEDTFKAIEEKHNLILDQESCLITYTVNPHVTIVTKSNRFSIESIAQGLRGLDIFPYGNHSYPIVAVAANESGDEYIFENYIKRTRYRSEAPTFIEFLAGDWNSAAMITNNVLGTKIRSRDELQRIDHGDELQVIKFILTERGQHLSEWINDSTNRDHKRFYNSNILPLAEWQIELSKLDNAVCVSAAENERVNIYFQNKKADDFCLSFMKYGNAPNVILKKEGNEFSILGMKKYGENLKHEHIPEDNHDVVAVKVQEYTNSYLTDKAHRCNFVEFDARILTLKTATILPALTSLVKISPPAKVTYSSPCTTYGSKAALLRRAKELQIKGRTTMSADALLEAIIEFDLQSDKLKRIPCGTFVYRASDNRYRSRSGNSTNIQRENTKEIEDQGALELAHATKITAKPIKVRGEIVTASGFFHPEVPVIPSKINAETNYNGEIPGVEFVTYPDVFTNYSTP